MTVLPVRHESAPARMPREEGALRERLDDATRECLLAEYAAAMDAYAYRDQHATTEFYISLAIVAGLVAVQEALLDGMGLWGAGLLGLLGLFALHTVHVDLMNISSCKRAAIDRALEIERLLGGKDPAPTGLQLARRIGRRKTYRLESMLKQRVPSAYLMIWMVRLLMLAWVAYAAWGLWQGVLAPDAPTPPPPR